MTTLGARSQTTSIEPKPAGESIEAALEKAFLTPRIIDQRAVDELSAVLRGLIREAGAHARTLSGATGDVKQLSDQLREAAVQLQGRVENAGRVLPAIDQRLERAQSAAETIARDVATRLGEYRDLLDRPAVVNEEAIRSLARAAAVAEIERTVAEQRAAFEAQLCERTREERAALERTVCDAETMIQRCSTVAAAIDGAATRAREAGEQLARSADLAEARLAAVRAQAEAAGSELATAQRSLEDTARDAAIRLGAAVGEAERRAGAIRAMLDERSEGVPQAATVLRLDEAGTRARQIGDALASLLERGHAVGEGLDRLLREAQRHIAPREGAE